MQAPQGYRYHTPIAIRYGDMDTLGHVNNAKYLTYMEQSRISYFRALDLWGGGVAETGMIMARIEIDYRAPITMDDGVATVWTRVTRLGNKSFEVENLITVERGDQTLTAATSKSVVVVYDYTKSATVPIPEAWRTLITAYEPGLGGENAG